MEKAKKRRTNYRDDDLLKAVGENIRLVRKSKGFTIESFANQIGVDYSQINRMELGKVNVTISMLSRIANELGVPLAKLLP
jgi:transcriptional regulator with XRE-family HTH domain